MTNTVYKLTTLARTTHGGHHWEPGVWYETSGEGDLCGPGWLHGYDHPLLALLLNPIHANIPVGDLVLWEAEGEGERRDDRGLKCGHTRMRVLRRVPLPQVTLEQRVRFAIAVSWVGATDGWRAWAMAWLDNRDRSATAAHDAATAAYDAATAAYAAAAYAAYDAAYAAYGAATAAYAAAAYAAVGGGYAANGAACAAHAAYAHATYAANARLIVCAEWAMTDSLEVPT